MFGNTKERIKGLEFEVRLLTREKSILRDDLDLLREDFANLLKVLKFQIQRERTIVYKTPDIGA